MTAPVALDGHPVRTLTLRVGNAGPWVADVELTEAPNLFGPVVLTIGEAALHGTIVPQETSVFGLSFSARVVGGANGWGRVLSRKGYHNDAGIKAQLLAEDAAREVGETLGSFTPERERIGIDYARAMLTASTVLEYAAGSAPWWVDYAGVTHVGERTHTAIPRDAYALLDFDELNQVATLGVNQLEALLVGGELNEDRLGPARIIRDLEVTTADNSPLHATAWCGGDNTGAGRLARIIRRLLERTAETRLFGVYRYRVAAMRGDQRVDLQAVRADLPDLRAIAQWPGAPGLSATLTPGTEVLVQFIDGDFGQPVLSAYVGPGGPGFVAQAVVLGGEAGLPVARQGDPVEVLLPPAQFVGTVNGLAATGIVSWLVPKANGTITGGSGKVKAAT